MARSFAAKGRDLALCARRTDLLDELKAELSQQYPAINIAVAALDVNDHEQVPKVFAALSDELGGIDRIIVNAGIGKGAKLGSGKLWANKATIETNLVAALVQIETAQRGPGRQSRLRGKQSRNALAGRITAGRIPQRPHQDLGD